MRRQGINVQVLSGFENFQIATHGFLGFQFLEKCRTFHFGQFLTHPKKNSGYFGIAKYVISRHISRCYFKTFVVLYDYKLFLTSYVGLSEQIWNFCNFCVLCFFHPQLSLFISSTIVYFKKHLPNIEYQVQHPQKIKFPLPLNVWYHHQKIKLAIGAIAKPLLT